MNRNPSMSGLASLVQSRGRGEDSMLVHMTPGEVRGLQSLALAAGGSLSVNPDTGLYEASFLKKLLPTVLGFGLNFLFPGLGALGSAALVGAGETIRTGGDLGKGLMAGLGAFGGAGLGAGLAGAAKAGGEAALTEVTTTAAAKKAAEEAAKAGAGEVAKTAAAETAKKGLFSLNPDMAGTFKSYGEGVKALGNKFGREGFMGAIPGGQAGVAAGAMGLSNALSPDMEVPEGGAYDIDDSYYQSYGYDPSQGRFLGGKFVKGYPGFPGYADGGSVIPRPNYSYPQEKLSNTYNYEPKMDPFTGEQLFAEGGAAGVTQGSTGGDPFNNITGTAYTASSQPQQSLEQYYQSLLTPPTQRGSDPAFGSYLQDFNKFVTSPVEAPKQVQPSTGTTTPPGGTTTPPGGTTTPPGGRRDGFDKFDPSMIDFSNIDFSNFNFGDFMGGQTGGINQYMTGGDSRMVWDPNKGTFVSQTPPAQTTSTTGTQNQYDPSKFDPSQYQYNPFDGNFIDPTTGMRKGPDVGSPMPDFDQLEYDPRGYEDYLPDNPFSDRRQNNLPANQSRNFVMPPEFDPTTGMRKGPDVGRPMPDFSQFDYAGATSGFDTGNTPIGSTEVAPQAQSDLSQYSFNPYVEGMGFGQASQTPQTPFGMNYGDYSFGMPQYAGGGAIQKAAAGKLVTGDGDGMSDDIRANINGDQEARLADGEFVIPADVVSHIGNGSTDAGAEKLYTMMDRIRKARTGRTKQAPEIDADKYLPA